MTLNDFSQDLVITGGPGGTAHVDFQRPTLLIAGPVPMQTDGLQFIVPQGTELFHGHDSGTAHIGSDTIAIPSQIAGNRLATSSPMLIRLDANRQLMSFDAVFPFDFAAEGNIDNVDINVDVAGSIRVTGSGLAPFADLPPVAVATVPATETCGQPITLDASASTDGNGPADIAVYRWTKPDGTVIATGKTVQVTLPPGDQVVVLHVIDTQGIRGPSSSPST